MTARYAVIIPHYNDRERLRRCLGALESGDRSETEIIVVDNGSEVEIDDVALEFPDIRFVVESGKGAALARNRGVAETKADHLIFLDADCVPDRGWLAAAKSSIGMADIVGGAIDVFDETPPPRSGAEAFETVFAFNYRDYIVNKGFSVTANLVTSRDVFADVGPFVHGVSEDQDWCLRAGAKGYRLTLNEALRVAHPTRSDWAALRHKWRRITREMFALHEEKRPGTAGRALWAVRSAAMAASGFAHLPKLLFSRRLNGAGERLRGAATLLRLRFRRAGWMLRQAFGGDI